MPTQHHQVTTHLNAPPDKVLGFIADVRNRTRYIPSLKALTDVKGGPAAVGTTWKWKFAILGQEFDGTARTVRYEPGKEYAFQTEGGLRSAWTYRVEPDASGTKLTVEVEYDVPDHLVAKLPSPQVLETLKKSEGELVMNNLRAILEK